MERAVLSERVKDRILQWILEGELAPGSRIVETRVARELGTSQAPVREALRDLATLGFVEMQPYRGSRVRQPSREELTEAIEVRAELEALAGRLAAVRKTEQCLQDLEEILAEMKDAADRGDAHDHALKNTEFHARIMKAAGNSTLERLWSMLEPFGRTYVTTMMPGADLHQIGQRHRRIIDAIRDGDPERAAGTSRQHAAEAAEMITTMQHAEPDGVPSGG
jgi:DNA-binding GntR family transcriptional regulator